MTKINPKDYINPFAERWLQALESGKYKQSTGALRDAYGFCCLGVACHLSKKATRKWNSNPNLYVYYTSTGSNDGFLPREVQKEIGLISEKGKSTTNELDALIHLNDRGASFKHIAATLQEHPECYFLPISEQRGPQ